MPHSLTGELDEADGDLCGLETFLEERDLGALAGPVEALNDDERAACFPLWHGGRLMVVVG